VLNSIPASSREPLPASDDTEIAWLLHPDVWGLGYLAPRNGRCTRKLAALSGYQAGVAASGPQP
jgi:hypothetical protein